MNNKIDQDNKRVEKNLSAMEKCCGLCHCPCGKFDMVH